GARGRATGTGRTATRWPADPHEPGPSSAAYRLTSWYQPRLGPNSWWIRLACLTPFHVESANIATTPTAPAQQSSATRADTTNHCAAGPGRDSRRTIRGAKTQTTSAAPTPLGVIATVSPVATAATPNHHRCARDRSAFSSAAVTAAVPRATNASGRMPSPNGNQQARKNTAVVGRNTRRRAPGHSGPTMPRLTSSQVQKPASTLGTRNHAGSRPPAATSRITCWTRVNGASEALNQR